MGFDEMKSFGMFQTTDRRERHQKRKTELGITTQASAPAAEQAD